ncbi:nuclease [Scytonema sp. UIC 10036]|uniref:nuclease A inhibitor family protein n=1 Tax=Scytonema sp. UIC 10036 TaxID=2304196 RepID=UPI0012DA7D54|nr:nuclease A inhibitor family protein [Scytonema sp. UIC 10036]MUG93224.1 nuclease [Scytonema sp. UIC 10036]
MNRTEVAAKLQEAASGVFMPSESESPFEGVYWQASQGSVTPQEILELTGHPQDASVEIVDLDYLFRNLAAEQEWHDDQQKEDVKKYKKLIDTLKTYLTDIQVYRIGKRNIDVYIIGKTEEGDYQGLSTKVVET